MGRAARIICLLLALLMLFGCGAPQEQPNNPTSAPDSSGAALDSQELSKTEQALAEIANPNKDCTEDVIQAMRVAYYHEPDSKLIPKMTGCAMDRLMYRYHYGKLSIDYLSYFCGIITNTQIDEELAAASLEIFVAEQLSL